MSKTTHDLEYPHPDCDAVIRVRDGVPPGTYPCRCHECKVTLSWAVYLGRGNVPHLRLSEEDE